MERKRYLRRKSPEKPTEDEWNQIEAEMVETAKKYMDNTERRGRKEDWYDKECKKDLISRNIAKIGKDQKPTNEAIKAYEEKRKIAKQICKRKKRIF